MAQQAVTSGAPNNNGTTILNGGNVTATQTNNLTLRQSSYKTVYGSHPFLAVTAASSGNLGTMQIKGAGTFGKLTPGQYNVRLLGTTLAGISSNVLKSGASDWGVRRPIHKLESSRRLHITSWNYATGAATYGGSRGAKISYAADDAAAPTMAIPGRLTFFTGDPVPDATSYAAKYAY